MMPWPGPDALKVTSWDMAILGDDPVGAAEELAAKGVDRVGVPDFIFRRETRGALAGFGERVISKVS